MKAYTDLGFVHNKCTFISIECVTHLFSANDVVTISNIKELNLRGNIMAITCDRHGNVKMYNDRKWFTLDGRGGRLQTPKHATSITAIAQIQGKQ